MKARGNLVYTVLTPVKVLHAYFKPQSYLLKCFGHRKHIYSVVHKQNHTINRKLDFRPVELLLRIWKIEKAKNM